MKIKEFCEILNEKFPHALFNHRGSKIFIQMSSYHNGNAVINMMTNNQLYDCGVLNEVVEFIESNGYCIDYNDRGEIIIKEDDEPAGC